MTSTIITWGIVAIIATIIIGYLLHWFYIRTSANIAFVRTGLGGEKVVLHSGGIVIPILHRVTYVNMHIIAVKVDLIDATAAHTKDRVRVDIGAEFLVKVKPTPAAVALAASSFGDKTLQQDGLDTVLSGRFTSILRSVVSQVSLDEAHENRDTLIEKIALKADDMLQNNGLELETVAIVRLDQTDMEHFRPNNTFDAQGLSELVKTIEEKRQNRNDTEQSAMVAIRHRNLQAEQDILHIDAQSETAKLDQERKIALMRAEQQADIKRQRVTEEANAEKIRIHTEQQIKNEEIIADKQLQQADIDRTIAIYEKQQQQAAAQVAYETTQLDVVTAEQNTIRQKEVLIAEYKAELDKILANKQADIAQIEAAADKIVGAVQAENQQQINEADNMLSNEARIARIKHKLIDHMEGIIRESGRPLENIEGIKILHVDGLGGGNGTYKSPTDEVIDSALRYRTQAALIDELMKDLGIDSAGVGKTDVFRTAKDAQSLLADQQRPNTKTEQAKKVKKTKKDTKTNTDTGENT